MEGNLNEVNVCNADGCKEGCKNLILCWLNCYESYTHSSWTIRYPRSIISDFYYAGYIVIKSPQRKSCCFAFGSHLSDDHLPIKILQHSSMSVARAHRCLCSRARLSRRPNLTLPENGISIQHAFMWLVQLNCSWQGISWWSVCRNMRAAR
jgi:hypothetical protein